MTNDIIKQASKTINYMFAVQQLCTQICGQFLSSSFNLYKSLNCLNPLCLNFSEFICIFLFFNDNYDHIKIILKLNLQS